MKNWGHGRRAGGGRPYRGSDYRSSRRTDPLFSSAVKKPGVKG